MATLHQHETAAYYADVAQEMNSMKLLVEAHHAELKKIDEAIHFSAMDKAGSADSSFYDLQVELIGFGHWQEQRFHRRNMTRLAGRVALQALAALPDTIILRSYARKHGLDGPQHASVAILQEDIS